MAGIERSPEYEGHEPDPALFIPPHKRREFVLNNGRRVLLLSGDMETDFNGTMIANGEDETSLIVAELLGQDKSEAFRPSL